MYVYTYIYTVCTVHVKLSMSMLFCSSSCFSLSCMMMAASSYNPQSELKHTTMRSYPSHSQVLVVVRHPSGPFLTLTPDSRVVPIRSVGCADRSRVQHPQQIPFELLI